MDSVGVQTPVKQLSVSVTSQDTSHFGSREVKKKTSTVNGIFDFF